MSMSTSSATYGSATYGSGTTGMATSNTGMSSNTGLNPCCNDPGHRESVACKTKGSRACYALVTGASDGIGNKVACGLLKNNIHVFLTARDEANAMATKRELEMCEETRGEAKCCLSALELDVLKDESITHCADRLKASGIKLDKLICNAGVATRSTNVTLKSARDCINVNFYGYWKTFEYLRSRGLLENGCSVIFVSSNMGIMSLEQSSKELLHRLFEPSLTVEGLSQIAEEFVHSVEQGEDAVRRHGFAIFEHTETQWDYAFSKALIIILTKILAKKYEGQYFINTVHPGYVQTAMTHHTKEADYTPQQGAEPIVQLAVATHKQTGCYYDRSECKYNLLFCSTSDIFLEKVKEQKSTMEKFKDKAKETWDKMKHPTTSSSSTTATAGGTTTTTTTTRH